MSCQNEINLPAQSNKACHTFTFGILGEHQGTNLLLEKFCCPLLIKISYFSERQKPYLHICKKNTVAIFILLVCLKQPDSSVG